MTSKIHKFYLNDGWDDDICIDCLPTFDKVMEADYEWLENTHDWIQLAFPNFEPSQCVRSAPMMQELDFLFLKTTSMKERIYSLVFKYLRHYGEVAQNPSHIAHNNRRVTRLIKFLVMLGYMDAAIVVTNLCGLALSNVVEAHHEWSNSDYFTTLEFWGDALLYKKEENNEPN